MHREFDSKNIYYVKKSEANNSFDTHDNRLKVLVAGFPPDTTKHTADICMETISEGREYSLILRNKKKFRGFAFILFDEKAEAEQFIEREHRMGKKILDCKIAKNHDDYINECLEELVNPKKVFAQNIPKSRTKNDLHQIFSEFGQVNDVIIITKKEQVHNNAFIAFDNFENSKSCVDKKIINIESDLGIEVVYARPKFSSLMLYKIDHQLKDYLENIKKHVNPYDPEEARALLNSINLLNSNKKGSGEKRLDKNHANEHESLYKKKDNTSKELSESKFSKNKNDFDTKGQKFLSDFKAKPYLSAESDLQSYQKDLNTKSNKSETESRFMKCRTDYKITSQKYLNNSKQIKSSKNCLDSMHPNMNHNKNQFGHKVRQKKTENNNFLHEGNNMAQNKYPLNNSPYNYDVTRGNNKKTTVNKLPNMLEKQNHLNYQNLNQKPKTYQNLNEINNSNYTNERTHSFPNLDQHYYMPSEQIERSQEDSPAFYKRRDHPNSIGLHSNYQKYGSNMSTQQGYSNENNYGHEDSPYGKPYNSYQELYHIEENTSNNNLNQKRTVSYQELNNYSIPIENQYNPEYGYYPYEDNRMQENVGRMPVNSDYRAYMYEDQNTNVNAQSAYFQDEQNHFRYNIPNYDNQIELSDQKKETNYHLNSNQVPYDSTYDNNQYYDQNYFEQDPDLTKKDLGHQFDEKNLGTYSHPNLAVENPTTCSYIEESRNNDENYFANQYLTQGDMNQSNYKPKNEHAQQKFQDF